MINRRKAVRPAFVAQRISDERLKELQLTVGKRLQEARKAQGYTIQSLAYEAKMSRVQIKKYEEGADLCLSSLMRLLHILGIRMEDVFKNSPSIAQHKGT